MVSTHTSVLVYHCFTVLHHHVEILLLLLNGHGLKVLLVPVFELLLHVLYLHFLLLTRPERTFKGVVARHVAMGACHVLSMHFIPRIHLFELTL